MQTIPFTQQKAGARWWMGVRQIAETVSEKLSRTFRLNRGRHVDHSATYYINLLPGVPIVESPFFASILASGYFDDWEKPIAATLHHKGYAVKVLRAHFLPQLF